MNHPDLPLAEAEKAVVPALTSFLTIVLKVSERCNLACPYCYFFFSGDETYKLHPPLISSPTVDDVIAFIREAVQDTGVQQIRVGFHGGEPLLMKPEPFAKMCAAFRSALDPICDLQLLVQTNGVLVNPTWIELFAKYQVRVGVSIDGGEAVHNIFRITKSGRGTYAETRRGWELLNQARRAGEIPSAAVLCVISPDQSGADVYRHFADELDTYGADFLLPDVTHDSPEASERFIRRCGDFMVDVYRAWATSGCKITVRFIDDIIGPLMSDELCRRSATRRYQPRSQFVVSSNGDISPDDVIRGVASRFRASGNNVAHSRAIELQNSDTWVELESAQRSLSPECQACIWKNICQGGAYQHRYSAANGFNNPSVYCPSLKRLFGVVTQHVVDSGYPIEQIERRLLTDWSQSPQEI